MVGETGTPGPAMGMDDAEKTSAGDGAVTRDGAGAAAHDGDATAAATAAHDADGTSAVAVDAGADSEQSKEREVSELLASADAIAIALASDPNVQLRLIAEKYAKIQNMQASIDASTAPQNTNLKEAAIPILRTMLKTMVQPWMDEMQSLTQELLNRCTNELDEMNRKIRINQERITQIPTEFIPNGSRAADAIAAISQGLETFLQLEKSAQFPSSLPMLVEGVGAVYSLLEGYLSTVADMNGNSAANQPVHYDYGRATQPYRLVPDEVFQFTGNYREVLNATMDTKNALAAALAATQDENAIIRASQKRLDVMSGAIEEAEKRLSSAGARTADVVT